LSVERSTSAGGGSGGGGSGGAGGGGGSAAGGRWDGGTSASLVEGGAEGTELDVGESDGGVGEVFNQVIWVTGGTSARSTLDARSVLITVEWEGGVEPQHVSGVITPDGHDQGNTTCLSSTHTSHTTELLEGIVIAEDSLLVVAEGIGEGVGGSDARDAGVGVGDDNTVLDIEAADLLEGTGVGTVSSDELSDNSHLLGGIKGLAFTIELLVAHTEGVEVTTILVANGGVSAVSITALSGTVTSILSLFGARMGSIGGGDLVGFPDIHLRTASTISSATGVGVSIRWVPSFNVGLSVDELDVVWALSIAVTGTILGTSLVVCILGLTTIGSHLSKVQSTVQTAGEVRNIDIESELLVVWFEHLILAVRVVHEVDTGTDVGRVWALGDILESEGAAGGGDTIGARVVRTLESAVLRTGCSVRAESGIKGATVIAVCAARGSVKPTPVRVEHNGTRLLSAGGTGTSAGTLGPRKLGVGLSSEATNLLGCNSSCKEDKGQQRLAVEHCE